MKLSSLPILAIQFLSQIRRNHALEHATIHVLNARNPKSMMIGRSDYRGFYLYSDLTSEELRSGAEKALERLRAGEHQLAVHPNCGTNILTAGVLSGSAAYFSLLGVRDQNWRDRLDRLPLAIFGAVLSLVLARPLGTRLQQKVTTNADVGSMQILGIRKLRSGKYNLYRFLTG